MTVIAPAGPEEAQTVVPPARSSRARLAWTCAGLVLAIAIVVSVTLGMVGSVAYQPLASRQRVFTIPITAVRVEVGSGDITIERNTGADTVVATSGVHGFTYPTDVEHVIGHILVIRSSCGTTSFDDRCARNYVLHLQPGVAVTADSSQGNVNVAGTDRSVSAHSDEGDVNVTGGSGTLRASSGQGGVTVSRSAATSVAVHSDQGDVAVDLMSPPSLVTASSGEGSVNIALPSGPTSYRVRASSGEGNVSDSVDNNPRSDRVVNASSAQGDVTVGYRPG